MANVNVEAYQSNIAVTSNATVFTISEGGNVISNVISTDSNVNVTSELNIIAVAETADIANSVIRTLFSVDNVSGFGNLAYNNTVISNGVIQYTGVSTQEIRDQFDVINTVGGDGSLSYSNTTGVYTYSGPTQAEANSRIAAAPDQVRAHISATDTGGDGSLTYSDTTGVITYTGPDQAEANARIDAAPANVRAHFSHTTGVADYDAVTGVITIPGTTDHITEAGNLWYTNARVKAYIEDGTRGHELEINTYGSYPSAPKGSLTTGSIHAQSVDATGVVNGDTLNTDNMTIRDTDGLFVNTEGQTYIGDANKIPVVLVNQPLASANTDVTIKYKHDTDEWLFTDGTGTEYNLPRSTTELTEGSNLYYTNARVTAVIQDYTGNLDVNDFQSINADFRFKNNDLILNHDIGGSNDTFIRVDTTGGQGYAIPHNTELQFNASFSTTQKKFGSKSLFVDTFANNGLLAVGQPYQQDRAQVIPVSGNATIECWIRGAGFSLSRHEVWSQYGYRGQSSPPLIPGLRLYADATGKLWVEFVLEADGTTAIMPTHVTMSTGTWYHVAVQREDTGTVDSAGETIYDYQVFVDGVLKERSQDPTTAWVNPSSPRNAVGECADSYLSIGANSASPGSSFWDGYIDEFRVSDNIRYSISGFTPSASAFTPDYNTVALMHMEDATQDLAPTYQPALRWNNTSNVWQFSNNSVTWSDFAEASSDAATLNGQPGSYYLDYNNFANVPTDLANFVNSPGYITQSNADTRYVNVTGDTMTGNLEISNAYPSILLTDTNTSYTSSIIGDGATLNIQLPDINPAAGIDYNPVMTNSSGIWFNRDATGSTHTGSEVQTPVVIHANGTYGSGNTIFWHANTEPTTGQSGWHFENADNVMRPFYKTSDANADIVAYFGDAANGPFTINGNLQVQGNIDYVNVEDLLVNDQSITLNYGNVAQDAFIYVDRTGAGGANVALKWNETDDAWQFTNDGSTYKSLIGLTDFSVTTTAPSGNGALSYSNTTGIFTFTPADITAGGTYGNADVQNFLENGYGSGNIVTTGDITAGTFTGDGSDLTSVRAETIEITIKNADTVQIDKGMPVHAIGTSVGGEVEVVLADAGNAQLMPAHFIANETLAVGDPGRGILSGRIFNVDTSSFSVGDTIFVAVGGGYANAAPSGEANLIQNLGVVTDVDVNGAGEVYGAGRAAATPNLDDGAIFAGSSANKAIAVDTTNNFDVSDTEFDLANALSNVNSITSEASTNLTLNTENKLIITQNVNGSDVFSGNVQSSGYAIMPGLTNSSSAWRSSARLTYANSDLRIFTVYANTTAGSATIDVNQVKDAFSSTPDTLSNVQVYASIAEAPFQQGSYVSAVDVGNSQITMNHTAATTETNVALTAYPAGVDTTTGFVFAIEPNNSPGGVNFAFPRNIVYGYPRSGPVASDFNWAYGTSGDYTVSDLTGFTQARTKFEAPETTFQSPRGIVIGDDGEISNRGYDDILPAFGQTILWSGTDTSDTYNTPPQTQLLLRSYTDLNTQNGNPSGQGPRLFFASNSGNVDQAYSLTYARANQELGRVAFWSSNQNNAAPSSVNPPAYISAQASNDYDSANSGLRAGNADVYMAAISAINTEPDMYLAYQGGRLTLGARTNGIRLAPAESPAGTSPQNAYTGNEVALWANVDYANTTALSGSKFTVTHGGSLGAGTVGDQVLSLKRVDNTYSTRVNQTTYGGNNYWTQFDPDVIVLDSSISDGTAVVPDGYTGALGTAINGNTYYLSLWFSSGGAYLYRVWTDVDMTIALNLGISNGDYGAGYVDYSVASGVTNKEYTFELPEQSANLSMKVDGNLIATYYSNTDVAFAGNVTYANQTDGTVTSVSTGTGLSGGPITTTGTISVDQGTDFSFTGNVSASNITLTQFSETVSSLGSVSGDISSSLDASTASIYTLTATGNLTMNSLANARAGTSMTIIITQDVSGNHTMSSSMKFAGGNQTLSTAGNAVDVISVFYDGSTYYASLTTDYS